MRKIACCLAVAGLLLPGPARAARALPDPDDTKGRLDVRTIEFAEEYGDNQDVLAYTMGIESFEAWSCNYLAPSKKTNLVWFFHDRGDRKADLKGKFICQDNALLFFLKSTDGSQNYEPLQAEQSNDKKLVRVTIPESAFDGAFRAWVKSKDGESPGCASDPCKDRAPNKGRL